MLDFLTTKFHIYGLLIGLGVWLGLEVSIKIRPKLQKQIENTFWWMIVGGVVGARVYHVVDFWQRYYRFNPEKIFFVWEGGLGIWGAVVGAVLGAVIYLKIKKENVWPVLDSLAVGAPLAQAIGRLGNWVNDELWGKNGEPLFAYEAALNLCLFTVLYVISGKVRAEGKLVGRYLIGYGVIRLLLEKMRPEETIWKVGMVPMAIIMSFLAIAFGLVCLFRTKA